jgi:hypothetical protein
MAVVSSENIFVVWLQQKYAFELMGQGMKIKDCC